MTIAEITERNNRMLEVYKKGIKIADICRLAKKDKAWFYVTVLDKLGPIKRKQAREEHWINRAKPLTTLPKTF
jgi:hypothetical protein